MKQAVHGTVLRWFRRLPRPMRRVLVRWGSPSYTVGSICVIERPDGAILLVRQAYRGNWGLPGGLLKRKEDPAEAARREVFEETGLVIELAGEPAVVVDAQPQRVDVVFRARPASLAALEDVRPRSPEIVEVRWFPQDQLPQLQSETATALVSLARVSTWPASSPLTGPGWINEPPHPTPRSPGR